MAANGLRDSLAALGGDPIAVVCSAGLPVAVALLGGPALIALVGLTCAGALGAVLVVRVRGLRRSAARRARS